MIPTIRKSPKPPLPAATHECISPKADGDKVSAWQVGGPEPIPQWVRVAFTIKPSGTMIGPAGQPAKEGDWVVMDLKERLPPISVMTNKVFNNFFVPL